ncbi:Nitrogen assimilation transcription factor nit-4 [Penicillium subrubescens]|uniref:Nitrogen assimilation transcription factor nit-4 n=1 Tax=Penicillium subrubescens TaxID=1316194 RepID=A0A1Q5SRM8_9EURO|nr:Nitrogen assimilation transcription factor nit-4 [Penicillium subrubescens]
MAPEAPVDDPVARRTRPGRKYTSRACEECRRRRAKCDGVRPTCSRCLDRGVRCQYSTAEDGRQPAPKSYVVMLRNRIQLLERVLHAHGIDADASIAQFSAKSDSPGQPPDSGGTAASNVDELCLTFDGALTLDESLNFDQDGEVRYFGPSSGRLLFRSPGNESPAMPVPEPEPYLNTEKDIPDDNGVSEELQAHLIDLYFEWEQPWFQVVNEKLFRESLVCAGRYCSPLLLTCVLASGSRYCDRVEVRSDPNDSNTAGRKFIERAERLVQHDLRWPKITTIQSLAIMGSVYIDSQGAVKKPFLQCVSDVHLPSADGNLRGASQKNVVQLHQAMIDLCRILEKILLSLWSPKPLFHAHHRSAFFDSCVLELKTWYYDLPSELKIERPSGPSRFAHTYTLYMVYHTAFILLCGPFLSGNQPPKNEEQNKSPEQQEKIPENPASQKALTACSASVRSMISIAQKYRHTFGSFKLSPVTATYCTLSAALIIIERCCSPENYGKPSPQEEGARTLSPHAAAGLCFQVLRELSTSWNIAKRIGRNLEKVYCDRFGQHIPSPPYDYRPPPCPVACQPMDSNQALESGIIPMQAFDAFFDARGLVTDDPLALYPENQVPIYAEGMAGQPFVPAFEGVNMDVLQNLPSAAELFASGHGFAFTPDCLPSDYNMFDTLNQMYLEETW